MKKMFTPQIVTDLHLKLLKENILTLAMMPNKALHKTPNLIGSCKSSFDQ